MKSRVLLLLLVLTDAKSFAHPTDSDGVANIPQTFRILFREAMNIKPNSGAIRLTQECQLRFNPSPQDRVIYPQTVLQMKVDGPIKRAQNFSTCETYWSTISNAGLWIFCSVASSQQCQSPSSIGSLRKGLEEQNIQMSFPQPVPFFPK